MCIRDQCDTILVSVDQRIIMPPLTSLSVPNKPFSQNTNITNIQQPPKLSKTSSWASQATRQPGRARPVQDGERRGQWWPGRARVRVATAQTSVSLLHGPPRPSDTARLGGEERGEARNQPGWRGPAAAARGEPRGSIRCTEPRPEHPGQGSLSIHTW